MASLNINGIDTFTTLDALLKVTGVGRQVLVAEGAIVGTIVQVNKSGWVHVRMDADKGSGTTSIFRANKLAPVPVKVQVSPVEPLEPMVFVVPPVKARKPRAVKAVKPTTNGRTTHTIVAGAAFCLCGCGEATKAGSHFRQGHDARFHGWMRKLADARIQASDVPASALALMNLVDGVPTTDWDGSAWSL